MNATDWESVKSLVHQALQLPESERRAFVELHCASRETRSEVESLLAMDAGLPKEFLEEPAQMESPENASRRADTATAGQTFAGRYLLLRLLGAGGSSQVWLAEQRQPVRREVAIKLIRPGLYEPGVLMRFAAEGQSLAMLDHPCIARIFDVGASDEGQPYIVMEHVPGQPIHEFCEQRALPLRKRLELFCRVCDGVQHAHQKALIHRDLKPANILVLDIDGEPVPRLIDFGIAKLLDGSEQGTTRHGELVGTPGYSSPEQFTRPASVDTRTDVYALGVILFLMLTGTKPFESGPGFAAVADWLRRVRSQDAPEPSSRIGGDPKSRAVAASRGMTTGTLRRALRGDLDAICGKALEREPEQRYATAAEFAADVRRHLTNEPVAARLGGAPDAVLKFARRHRLAVGLTVLAVLLLAGFSVQQGIQLRTIARERDRADRVADFLTGIFRIADPGEAQGNRVSARELLDRAVEDIDHNLVQDPRLRSDLLRTMAISYANLGLYQRGLTLISQALDLRRQQHASDDARVLQLMSDRSYMLDRLGRQDEAELAARETLAQAQRVLGQRSRLALQTADILGIILQRKGKLTEAENLHREVVQGSAATLGPENLVTLRARNNLGTALARQGRYSEALALYTPLVAAERRVLGPSAPETLLALGNYAELVSLQTRPSRAEPLFRELLATDQRVLGPSHPNTAEAMDNLSQVLLHQGKQHEAEQLQRKAFELRMAAFGPASTDTLMSAATLAEALRWGGQFAEAEQVLRSELAAAPGAGAESDTNVFSTQSALALVLLQAGHRSEAEALARATLAHQSRILGVSHPETLRTLQTLGVAIAAGGRAAEADALFEPLLSGPGAVRDADTVIAVWYARAAVAAAARQPAIALQNLRLAVRYGYHDPDTLANDPELSAVHAEPGFSDLLSGLRRKFPAS